MRKVVAILALGVMVVGLLLTVFGTQAPASQRAPSTVTFPYGEEVEIQISGEMMVEGILCPGPTLCEVTFSTISQSTQPDFTLNYVGALSAILGAIGFAIAYPSKHSSSLRIYAIPVRL